MEDEDPSWQAIYEIVSLSFPRGGPIFVPDLVSSYTRVSVFVSEMVHEVESLRAELESNFLDLEEDISVTELKILTDEDLVTEAMKVVFEDDDIPGTSSDITGNPCCSRTEDNHGMLDPDTSVSCESPVDSESSDSNAKKRKRSAKKIPKSRKTRKRTTIASKKEVHVDESYLVKVEHFKRIMQKQKEDRPLVQLHSFKGMKKDNAAVSSGKLETLKCVESSTWPIEVRCSRTNKNIPIQYPEVVLCVEIYHPKHIWTKTHEFLVLGCQSLNELRDKIRCLTDVAVQKAVELEKDNNHSGIMNDPSGYFLIEGLFCNDMGDPNAIDYSEPILDWLENSKEEARAKWNYIISDVGKAHQNMDKKPLSELPKFRTVDMDRTRFCDLGFRLGAGYLYCHQGDCKHIIGIRDMRLIHPDDVQNRAAYPLLVHQRKKVLKKCNVCNISKAKKVTLDDKLAGENPCYFCDTCYFLLHYSKDGELLFRNFKVYDYVEDYC